MAKNLLGKSYKDMSNAYQKRNSRKDFRSERDSQRMAGDAVSNSSSNSSNNTNSSNSGSSSGGGGTSDRREYKDNTSGYLNLSNLDYKNSTVESDQEKIRRKERQIEKLDSGSDAERIAKMERRIGKAEGRIAAKEEGEFSGNLEDYNFAQYGSKHFDDKDIAFLSSQGFSDSDITDYANNLSRNKIHGSAQVLDGFDIQRDNVVREDGSYDASVIGRKQNKFGGNDLRAMSEGGLTEKESARQLYDQEESTTRSRKAQALLDKYRNEFQNTNTVTDPETGVDPLPVIQDPTNPSDPSDPTTPVGPGPGDPTLPTPTNPGDPTNPLDPTVPPGTETIIGGGTADIINSGNTNITDSFNGGTVDISGTITAGGDFTIDNSNNSSFYGGDNLNGVVATGGSLVSPGAAADGESQSATDAQALLNSYISGGSASVEGSGNTDIDNSFNGGTVDISGEITAGGDVNIDNSNNSSYYGGDNTNISVAYGGGSNPMNTGAVSHLTTLGYGKPSDSPASQAKFVDMYSNINEKNQDKYGDTGTSVAAKYIANAAATNPINYVALNQSISERIQDHYDRSEINQTLLMGDKYNYKPPTFQMPDPLKPVTSNAEDIADDYKDELNG